MSTTAATVVVILGGGRPAAGTSSAESLGFNPGVDEATRAEAQALCDFINVRVHGAYGINNGAVVHESPEL